MDTRDLMQELTNKVGLKADANGYSDSAAYQYGYFISSIAGMLNELLTDKQKETLAKEIARMA